MARAATAGGGAGRPLTQRALSLQTFSGGYVHVLKGALSEDLLIQSFQKMGYVPRGNHCLQVTAPPPACQLVQAALGCFALRLECEILGEVLARLGTSVLPAEELLQARRASGDVASCVAWLQQRLAREEEPPPLPPRGSPAVLRAPLDLYRDLQGDSDSDLDSDGASLYGGPSPGPGSPALEPAYRPLPWEQSAKLWGPQAAAWEPPEAAGSPPRSPPFGALEEEGPEPEAFSFLALRRELSQPGDPAAPEGAQQGRGPEAQPPGYQVHGCLAPGALPARCCHTCRQLHTAHCAALPTCRGGHELRALLGEAHQRLWLQRAEVDTLLYSGSGARP